MGTLYEKIQKGENHRKFISPSNARRIAKEEDIMFPEQPPTLPRRNIFHGNNIWNRNIIDDFYSFEMIKRCILYCIADYRTTENNYDESEQLYQNVLKISYASKFNTNAIEQIIETLKNWDMDARGAKLTNMQAFSTSLLNTRSILDELYKYSLIDFCEKEKVKEIEKLLLSAYKTLDLAQNHPFVTISKTLHFYMPQLFVPIDRTYTINYFTNYKGVDLPHAEKKDKLVRWMICIHQQLVMLYKKYKKDFDKLSVQTRMPVTKLLDNTLIGFAMYRQHYCQLFNPREYIMKN